MAPPQTNQLLVWTLPIAVLVSYFWYRRRRVAAKRTDENFSEQNIKDVVEKEDIREKSIPQSIVKQQSPNRNFCRSLSGVESAPIDIILPPKLKASKSNPVVISDEDLDLEIEKIKSMKNGELTTPATINNCINMSKNKNTNNNNNSSSSASSTSSPPRSTTTSTTTTEIILSTGQQVVEKSSSVSPNNNKLIVKVTQKSEQDNVEKNNKTPKSQKMNNINNNNNTNSKNNKGKQKPTQHEKKSKKSERQQPTRTETIQAQSQDERDSANQSPVDGIISSLMLSSISDNHSEGSNDSGKGGSEVITPPPSRTPGADSSVSSEMTTLVHQFVIPQTLVGHLIGKNGSFIQVVQDKTGANIYVKKHPTNNKLKLCLVDGTQKEINSALKLIREKFPIKRFPKVTLEHVSFASDLPPVSLVPDYLSLKLIEGINNDTILSCVVSPNHIFLQQPTHPSFINLNMLINWMDYCYSQQDTSPLLPTPIPPNTVCAAFSVDHWLRATVISTDEESKVSYVKFLDQGGYSFVEYDNLRQIRGDFMTLPFQAAECILANVQPPAEGWPEGATEFIAEITKGVLIYTQVIDYVDDGIPLVFCYLAVSPTQLVHLNQEIVNQGYGEWVSLDQQIASLRQNAASAVIPFASLPVQQDA